MASQEEHVTPHPPVNIQKKKKKKTRGGEIFIVYNQLLTLGCPY
jgi:hypothetical protein